MRWGWAKMRWCRKFLNGILRITESDYLCIEELYETFKGECFTFVDTLPFNLLVRLLSFDALSSMTFPDNPSFRHS